jgi:hypothetical protein
MANVRVADDPTKGVKVNTTPSRVAVETLFEYESLAALADADDVSVSVMSVFRPQTICSRSGTDTADAAPLLTLFSGQLATFRLFRLGDTLVIVHEPPVKKRAANAAQENAGINHVRHITDREEHIFRRVHEEDVGVDAHIELCYRPEEPSGFVVGLQVKAGVSYIKNETEKTFTFYPSIEDLQYWRSYALPIYLVVYHPARDVAYWLDIKKACDEKRFADMLAGISPRKLVFQKCDTFADTFFHQVVPADDLDQQRLYHTLLATAFADDIDVSTPELPIRIYHRIRQLDASTAAKMLRFVDSKFAECVQKMMANGQRDESLVEEYVREVALKLRERAFTAEGSGRWE